MTLLDEVEAAWTPKHDKMAADWATALENKLPQFLAASKRFKAPAPLDVYLTVSRAKQPTPKFSLRFLGQEVAELVVKDDVMLKIGKELAATNAKYFGIPEKGVFAWNDARGIAFRKHFKSLDHKSVKVGVPEHLVEAEFLKHMRKGGRGKFGGPKAGIQPVDLAGCRFQLPLPLSASSGSPKDSRGSIDILARRGSGRGTRLSVWELKAPDKTASAIEQAYIYAVTLLKVLRSSSGEFWYRTVFGFNGKVPKRLTVEAVVAVSLSTDERKEKFESAFEAFRTNVQLQVGDDSIKLLFAYYDHKPRSLKIDLRNAN
jgi:hypothetical protein